MQSIMVGSRLFQKLQYVQQSAFDTIIMRIINREGGELQHYKYVFPRIRTVANRQQKQKKTSMYRNACNHIVLHSF